MRKASMKTGCPATIRYETQSRPGPNSTTEMVYYVKYNYQHNHSLGGLTKLGTKQKSSAIKATIRSLLLQGSSIAMVMQQLTMEHDKFMQIFRNKGTFSRDDFVTYEDVYNIWHSIISAKMRKDSDPVVSAIKWMEELNEDGAYTYYDHEDRTAGVYFGFATTWQMEQLRAFGRTICFDGTHNVFG
jgi:hypothetical protein